MFTNNIPWLTALILVPLIAAFAIPFIPDKEGKTLRSYSLGVSLLNFGLTILAISRDYDFSSSNLQLSESYNWIPTMGLGWSLGIDGLSMPLIVLSGLITTVALLASWNVKKKPQLFYFLMLVLYSAQIGVFAAQDVLLFFFMWELELVPVYLLISIWGGEKRLYAATKFILYTALASIGILVSALLLAFYGDNITFNMAELSLKEIPTSLQVLIYIGFLIAYAVKLPIFPLHTWLPDAHSQASTPVSMLLACVLLKMGDMDLLDSIWKCCQMLTLYLLPYY